jgi:hypothetical protein
VPCSRRRNGAALYDAGVEGGELVNMSKNLGAAAGLEALDSAVTVHGGTAGDVLLGGAHAQHGAGLQGDDSQLRRRALSRVATVLLSSLEGIMPLLGGRCGGRVAVYPRHCKTAFHNGFSGDFSSRPLAGAHSYERIARNVDSCERSCGLALFVVVLPGALSTGS